ncbi:Glyoxylase, beta-lactamase superfamily II [Pedobacter rhizosphaerae]|uniref:Glyoxylase, beta-lactamase superfamily II n=2 Tax=Pedobacter rhizosphaerae TaxID=390241 RepID=A0A1H9JVX6_9SPHI|nr:Glyoxylase, beta-lactamase superfamily II [Pedobacter rhizosphaerae]
MAMLSIYKSDVFAQQEMLRAYNFKPLRNNVGIFTEQGGTIAWLNSSNGFVVVDAQFPNTAPHVIEELKKLGEKPFKYLLNTHHHGDHTGGNIAFKGLAQKVVAHQNSLVNQKRGAEKATNLDKQLLPDTTFGTGWKAKIGDERISAYYYGSGHTNGDAVYHFENANIAHLGDLVFNRKFPYIDRENGAHIGNWISALDKIINQFDNDTQFVWGHSFDPEKVTGNKADVKAYQNYLQNLLSFVGGEIKAGKSKEDILKSTSIPNASEWQGEGIQRSLGAAYDELKGV